MRNFVLATSLLLAATACTDRLADLPEPPVLKVTSPERSLIRDGAGTVLVIGRVAAGPDGSPVEKVMVNNMPAVVGADGKFQATIDVKPGASLIHTEALAENGGKATDTRAIHAGELRTPGANIEQALTTAISKEAFAKIASVASGLITTTDFKPILMPMNPMVHKGDENGEDCMFARMFVDDFKLSNAMIKLVPVNGGLTLEAKIDGVDVPGRLRYAAACLVGETTTRIRASSILIRGTLLVSPDGMKGFKTDLADETVQITGLDVTASGIPGAVLELLPLESAISAVAPIAAKLFMGPMVNKALGGLGGPKQLMVMGKTINVEVSPSQVVFDAEGGLVTLDTKILIAGTETSKGFIFTDNGYPTMDPGNGLALGLADDLANSMMSQLVATGMLDVTRPAHGGTFDSNQVTMTLPPMISADPANGMMRLVLGDVIATFTLNGTPVAKAAINATVELKISPTNNGYGIAIELGKPVIHADVLDDIPNVSMLEDADLAEAAELSLDSQLASISTLLNVIPLPTLPGGLVVKDLSVSGDDGYVVVKGAVE